MELEIEKIRQNIRKKKHNDTQERNKETKKPISNHITKLMVTIILTLICLIGIKKSEKFKTLFYTNIYENNFSFATINSLYKQYFGTTLPLTNILNSSTETVFSEEFNYISNEKYLDGEKFTVEKNYLMPVLNSGIIVYIGEKEGYGNTIIVQQVDGVDIWYSNITSNVKLYDYIEKGDVLGETVGDIIYLTIKKDGKYITYEDYI